MDLFLDPTQTVGGADGWDACRPGDQAGANEAAGTVRYGIGENVVHGSGRRSASV